MSGYAYAACPVDSVDASTGSCTVPVVYVEPPQFLPPLSISDAVTISMAIAAAWAVGFGVKAVRRVLENR